MFASGMDRLPGSRYTALNGHARPQAEVDTRGQMSVRLSARGRDRTQAWCSEVELKGR